MLHSQDLLSHTHSRIYARATGARAQGGILKKKSRLKYGMRGKKKGCPRERNLREIYTENNVGTTARRSFLVTTLLALEGAEAIAYWGGGGAKFSWAQGRKIPKYGPGCTGTFS